MPNWFTTPLVPPSVIKPAQDAIDTPTADRGPWEARLRGFGAGALEGLRQQTSPLGLAGLAASAIPAGVMGRVAGGAAKVAPEAIQGLRGVLTGPAAQTAAQAGADILNPATARVMQSMHEAAAPTFQAMERAGAFAGDRTVGGLHSLANRASSMLPAEFTPPGAEAVYNAARPAAQKVVDPVQAAYLRLLAAGGR